jgi:threonine 3-dehydrogenase
MSGNATAFRSMVESMNNGGKIASLGIFPEAVTLDWSHVIFKGLVVKGIYGREMYETWYKMTSLLGCGLEVSQVITHHFKADQFADAFNAVKSGKAGKVVLEW